MRWFGFEGHERPPAAADLSDEMGVPQTRCLFCRRRFTPTDRGFRLISGQDVHQFCLLDNVLPPGTAQELLADDDPG
jgi:hypothetical protein